MYASRKFSTIIIVLFFFLSIRRPPRSTRTDTLFPTRRSSDLLSRGAITQTRRGVGEADRLDRRLQAAFAAVSVETGQHECMKHGDIGDRKSTRLNSSH